jgi:NADPH-dependent ferric siderophore reductase
MPRALRVVSVARLTPRLVSVQLSGDALEGFTIPAPTAHIKVFFPEPDGTLTLPTPGPDGPVWPDDVPRPVVRTYTPRRFEATTGVLEVQFLLHGDGRASEWAASAQVGDRLAVAGPGGRFSLDADVRRWWIAGDESAIPAIGTLLEALPATATAELHVEVDGATDELSFSSEATTSVVWHHRRVPNDYGSELFEAVRSGGPLDAANSNDLLDAARSGGPLDGADRAAIDVETRVWVACEANAMRRIRAHLLAAGVPASTLTTRGYWRIGEANHPDHDYGED